jgi:hypothetical protein
MGREVQDVSRISPAGPLALVKLSVLILSPLGSVPKKMALRYQTNPQQQKISRTDFAEEEIV